MKRIISVLLILSIAFIFFSCSNESNTNETTLKNTTQESTMTNTAKPDNIINVKIGNKTFSAKLYDNETAKAFVDMLPLTLDMNELNGNEKYFNLDSSLPTESINIGEIRNGDIMLYGDHCLVLFYDSFSSNYSYTKIGHIEKPAELADAVGNGDITITFDK